MSRPELLSAAQTLAIDSVTVEVMQAFDEAGVPALLLKGPVFAQWLYGPSELRPYTDADLLVPRSGELGANQVLRRLGFMPIEANAIQEDGVAQIHSWQRRGIHVELHVRLQGIEAEPDDIWRAFSQPVELFAVAGSTVKAPNRTARLVHVALHAAQHGAKDLRPQEDLKRALASHTISEWELAIAMGTRLRAAPAMRSGLLLVPQGREIRARIDFSGQLGRLTYLRSQSAPSSATSLERVIGGSQPLRGRLAAARQLLFPRAGFMQQRYSMARRGGLGLALSYVERLFYLAFRLPRGLAHWLLADIRVRKRDSKS